MKIIRYTDRKGNIGYAARQNDGSALKLKGDIYAAPQITPEKADVAKVLAPIQPGTILCIGLNYRRHAQETGAKIPEYPVLFFKSGGDCIVSETAVLFGPALSLHNFQRIC